MIAFTKQVSMKPLSGGVGIPWALNVPYYTRAFFSGTVELVAFFEGTVQ